MIVDISRHDLDSLHDEVEFADLESSQIHRVAHVEERLATMLGWNAYDPEAGGYWEDGKRPADEPFLLVEFRTKDPEADPSIYVYRGADHDTFKQLIDADSAGRFLHASVKAVHPFIKLRLVEEYAAPDETSA